MKGEGGTGSLERGVRRGEEGEGAAQSWLGSGGEVVGQWEEGLGAGVGSLTTGRPSRAWMEAEKELKFEINKVEEINIPPCFCVDVQNKIKKSTSEPEHRSISKQRQQFLDLGSNVRMQFLLYT